MLDAALPTDDLRVAHVTPTLSRRGGGVSSFVWSVARLGRGAGVRSNVAGLDDAFVREDTTAAVAQGVEVFAGRTIGPKSLGWSPALRRYLTHSLPPVDLVHAHGLRMLPALEARRLAQRRKLPLMISPHGQLDPWVMAANPLRKRILGALYDNANLRAAACLHATAAQEARHFRALGLTNPIAVIPIGIDAEAVALPRDPTLVERRWPELKGRKRLLFLSTIYRKKGLLTLADAWNWLFKLHPDWTLVIGGVELNDDRAQAQQRINAGGAQGATLFTGPVSDENKRLLMAGSDVFVLPTMGENFGIVIGEALASGLPVITTVNTPWRALHEQDCGWWIEPGIDSLCAALADAMGRTDDQRAEMGARGQLLIRERFGWSNVIERMAATYRWLAGRAAQPDCVYTSDRRIDG